MSEIRSVILPSLEGGFFVPASEYTPEQLEDWQRRAVNPFGAKWR